MFKKLILVSLLLACVFSSQYLSVRQENGQQVVYTHESLEDESISAPAKAYFSDSDNHESNFGQLEIVTNETYADNDQAYHAGYLEGYVTAERLHQVWENMKCQVACNGTPPANVSKFFETQEQWAAQQIKANPDNDYWKLTDTIVHQFEGLIKGYHDSAYGKKHQLTRWSFQMINAIGDLFEILPAVDPSKRADIDNMTPEELQTWQLKHGHCSAIIKVADDLSDIFAGHSSWFTYSNMLRIFKRYHFNFQNKACTAKKVTFSSYPGYLASQDDFYMMDSGLLMTQTTNNIMNNTLYDYVTPKSLLAWHRVRLANMIAGTGKAWYEAFEKHNSGTYTNQYMIVDYDLFKPNNALVPNTLWVIEQIPGKVFGADTTEQLSRAYWPSYNIAYFREAYALLGYGIEDEKNNQTFYSSYELAPRAKIFRRDHEKVSNITGLKTLLRYNDFENDPFSDGNPDLSICSRADLGGDHEAGGCYDSKGTNAELFKDLKAWIINGPTHEQQPVFKWSEYNFSDPHVGQPNVFDFKFELVSSNASSTETQVEL